MVNLYSTCIECFNKKVKCEFCNKELNKTYLSKHLKRCNINHDNTNTEGALRNEIINHNENHDNNNYTNNIITNDDTDNNDIMFTPEASKAVIEH